MKPASKSAPARSAGRGRRGKGVDVRPGSIREARQQANLTMAMLGGDELTRGAIWLFESGRARPSREALELIATQTGKPTSFFLASPESGQQEAATSNDLAHLDHLLTAGRLDDAWKLGDRLLESPTAPLVEAAIRLSMAQAAVGLGNLEAGLLSARRAHQLASGAEGDGWLTAEARVVEATALAESEDPGALGVAQEALAEARALSPAPPWIEERLLHLVGVLQGQRGEWAAAAEAHASAFSVRPTAQTLAQASDAMEAAARRHAERGNRTLSTLGYARAGAARAVANQLGVAVRSGIELGRALRHMGQVDAARGSLESALTCAMEHGLERERFQALLGLAEVVVDQARPEEAQALLDTAWALAEAAADRHSLGLSHLLAGRLAAGTGDHAAADVHFRQALDDLDASGDAHRLLEARAAYAEVLEAQGRIGDALAQWKRAATLHHPGLDHWLHRGG